MYYAHVNINTNDIINVSQVRCLDEGILNVEIAEDLLKDIQYCTYNKKKKKITVDRALKNTQEQERIQALRITRSDFFDGIIRAFGLDEDEVLPILQKLLVDLIEDEIERKVAVNNYKNAIHFYRNHKLFDLLSDKKINVTKGENVIIGAEQWDKFFVETCKKNADAYKELLPKEEK